MNGKQSLIKEILRLLSDPLSVEESKEIRIKNKDGSEVVLILKLEREKESRLKLVRAE